jgi:hypothetical protein
MMPVSLHEQVDEVAAASKIHTVMWRAKDAVQQDTDRRVAEQKYQLSKKGQYQPRDTQHKRKVGYGAADGRQHLCASALSMTMAPGFTVLHPFRVSCTKTGTISVLLQMCLQLCQG